MTEAATPPATPRRRWLLWAPVGVLAAGGAGFYAMLRGLRDNTYQPRGVPSVLVGQRPAPFSLPPLVEGRPGLSEADLRDLPRPVLVNFWASWCVPCIIEHPQLMRLSRDGVPVFGVNYKDRAPAALAFLAERGDPFVRSGRDEPGRLAIDWGVYGVPETYLIDRAGIVRWRFPGAVTPEVLRDDIQPLLRRHA